MSEGEAVGRTPSQGVLTQVVRDHFETFRAQAAGLRDGEGLPRFVEQAAFARGAPASLAEALAEAGIPRVPALRPSARLRASLGLLGQMDIRFRR